MTHQESDGFGQFTARTGRTWCGVLSVLVLFWCAWVPSDARAAGSLVHVEEARNNRSLGVVEVHASPRQVRAAVLDFAQWPRLFSDVKWVKVQSRTATEAIVEVKSRGRGRSSKLRVRLDDPSGTRFETLNGRGVHLQGAFSFEPVDRNRTRIRGALYTNVTGVRGWFASDRSIRNERQDKLRSYLSDISAWFARS